MEKLNLTPEQILEKTFNVDFKGYSAKEVDEFLDVILEDYQTFAAGYEELSAKAEELSRELDEARKQILTLQGRQKAIDLTNTTSYSSVDLLKRVSRLEEEVFGK